MATVGEKSTHSATSVPKTPSSTEKTKADSTNAVSSRKINTNDKNGISGKSLNKNSLSKSQDNLASTLRKKAAAAALAGNKESVGWKGPSTPGSKPKTVKQVHVATPIRKAHSIQNISNSDTPMKRAQSAQNISKPAPNLPVRKVPDPVKRAASSHNISTKTGRLIRKSPPSNIMAYNAELLASFEKEKKILERRISELVQITECRKTDIEKYKFEVKNLKSQIPTESFLDELDLLRQENSVLKGQLRELGVKVESETDSEKLYLLQQKMYNEEVKDSSIQGDPSGLSLSPFHGQNEVNTEGVIAPIAESEAALSIDDFSCITPEHPSSLSLDNSNWEKSSNKSDALSEISVACLQDRISQMVETHYSTNEELQATLQELGDLQDAVNQLTDENERLADERTVLLESLCAQTEKLENCRMQIEHMKALLLNECEGGDRSETERQLVALVKSAQEEREELILRQLEMNNSLGCLENENKEFQDIVTALRDKAHILDMKNDTILCDKRSLDNQLIELKEQLASEHIEVQRYKTLLENEKQKVAELEQERNATDKSDLEELLDSTRQEKERLEIKSTNDQQELALLQNEQGRLREIIVSLEDKVKVCENNAKKETSDMGYKLKQTCKEKIEMQAEVETLRDHIDQLQQDCDRYVEQQKLKTSGMTRLEAEIKEKDQHISYLEKAVEEARAQYSEEREEWQQFQQDLQTAVVIANEIKTETQEDIEVLKSDNTKLIADNKRLQREHAIFTNELKGYRQIQSQSDSSILSRQDIRGRVLSTVDRELAFLRQGKQLNDPRSGNQNLPVKKIIATIEEQGKVDETLPTSPSCLDDASPIRRGSSDSLVSISSIKSELSSRSSLDRQGSVPESQLKSVLRRSSDGKERPQMSHRHTISNIIYDSAPVTDDAKVTTPGGFSDSDSPSKKPLTSILSNKGSMRRTSNGYV